MDDLISRYAAIDALNAVYNEWQTHESCSALEEATSMIEELPSAERKGKWITYYHGGTNFSYSCNQCGAQAPFLWNSKEQRKTSYCYNCGARMERREE